MPVHLHPAHDDVLTAPEAPNPHLHLHLITVKIQRLWRSPTLGWGYTSTTRTGTEQRFRKEEDDSRVTRHTQKLHTQPTRHLRQGRHLFPSPNPKKCLRSKFSKEESQFPPNLLTPYLIHPERYLDAQMDAQERLRKPDADLLVANLRRQNSTLSVAKHCKRPSRRSENSG